MMSDIEPSRKFQTGYILPDIQYPDQPVIIAELSDVVAMQLNGRRAFPFIYVCEALGFNIALDEGLVILTKDGEAHTIDTRDNADFSIMSGTLYATESVFNVLFSVSFRYFESVKLLQIFR